MNGPKPPSRPTRSRPDESAAVEQKKSPDASPARKSQMHLVIIVAGIAAVLSIFLSIVALVVFAIEVLQDSRILPPITSLTTTVGGNGPLGREDLIGDKTSTVQDSGNASSPPNPSTVSRGEEIESLRQLHDQIVDLNGKTESQIQTIKSQITAQQTNNRAIIEALEREKNDTHKGEVNENNDGANENKDGAVK